MPDVVTVRIKGIDKLLKGFDVAPELLEEESRKAMGQSVGVIKGALEPRINLGPGREGHLRSMVTMRVLSAPVRGLVAENKFNARFYEFGTRPHLIKEPSGRVIHHPGSKGRHAMRRAVGATRRLIRAYFLAAATETLRRIVKGG